MLAVCVCVYQFLSVGETGTTAPENGSSQCGHQLDSCGLFLFPLRCPGRSVPHPPFYGPRFPFWRLDAVFGISCMGNPTYCTYTVWVFLLKGAQTVLTAHMPTGSLCWCLLRVPRCALCDAVRGPLCRSTSSGISLVL